MMKRDENSSGGTLYRRLEDVIGCKWSVSVLLAVRKGIVRPGALERHISGISTKVLSERLRKLTQYGLLSKTSFPEVPPRTEYGLTQTGQKVVRIIGQIHKVDQEHRNAEQGGGHVR